MSRVFVFSDPHFGHEKLAIHRGFSSAKEQDELIIKNWNKTIHKRDTVYLLGDITMEKDNYSILKELNGIINVAQGNHDKPQHTQSLLNHVNKVASCYKLKDCLLTHIPIHPFEINRFKYNIHGHVHLNTIKDYRYINVCAEVMDYTPILLDALIK